MNLTALSQLWSNWGLQVYVLLSLAANVTLGLLSGTRRRLASGWWAKAQLVPAFLLWFAYQVAEAAASSAIGNLTLCGSDTSEEEKQLVAFWAPFLLLHLGGPDNLTAYALEDNKLSLRKGLQMLLQFLGVGYSIYSYTYGGGHSRFLLAASAIMFVAGAARYGERARALWRANLDNMQEDSSSSSPAETKADMAVECRIRWRLGRLDQLGNNDDDEALLLAQDLFPVWRHAMVDSSVDTRPGSQGASEDIVRLLKWESMCKVAEMELSLMYEVLYTKAILAYSWNGCYYLIRFLSPLLTFFAALLFWLHNTNLNSKQQQQIRGSFVGITYALLGIAFLQDVTWLLRSLGSTWTYANLKAQAPAWLCHQVLHAGRWCCLHRVVIRLDPLRWLLHRDPVRYRTWSGTIGRYNLLDECVTARRCQCPGWLVAIAGDRLKELRYLSKLPKGVKQLLLERVQGILREAIKPSPDESSEDSYYTMADVRTYWGQKAFLLRNTKLFQGLSADDKWSPKFGKEFEEDVLSWHIATCIALPFILGRRRICLMKLH